MKLTRDELMRCLADRPGCCATVREAAAEEIERLSAKETSIEDRLAIAAAKEPRSEVSMMMLEASHEIVSLRTLAALERARRDA